MGLDMYAFTAPRTAITASVDFTVSEIPEVTELHYWRKHPNLHGWMEQLYRDKGGSGEHFNCEPVVISADELDELEQAIHSGSLPYTEGFFFGESDGKEKEDDLAFIAKARTAIASGLAVFYDSWW